jgi:hypothetical protein
LGAEVVNEKLLLTLDVVLPVMRLEATELRVGPKARQQATVRRSLFQAGKQVRRNDTGARLH